MKIPLIAAISLLTMLIAIPLAVPSALASNGLPVTDPNNKWFPYGPYPYDSSLGTPGVNKILYHFYNDPDSELAAFETGQLDLPDSQPNGVPPSSWGAYTSNPDFSLSPVQGQFGMFQIDQNLMSNRYKAWGCDWANGNSLCGIRMREAFAHLMDTQQWVIDGPLGGAGQALADPSPPAKDPSGSPLSEQCSWDTLPQYHNNCNFAYHTGPPCSGGPCTENGSGGVQQPDFCAAVSYMIDAAAQPDAVAPLTGLTRDASAPLDSFGNRCGLSPGSVSAMMGSNPILAFIRNNDPNRLDLGNKFMSALNTLFVGGPGVSATYGTIAQARPIVFRDGFTKGAALWDFYTGGYGLGGPLPDHIYPLYNGIFASNACGGNALLAPVNYRLVCIPAVDTDSAAAQNAATIPAFRAATLAAFHDLGTHAVHAAIYSPGLRTAALKAADGIVNQLGAGYNNFYTLLSAHKGSYVATPGFGFGGSDPTTLRYGQSGATSQLNMFQAQTVWEAQVDGQIYDTLFAGNPVVPSQIYCFMCDNYQQSVDANGDTHFDVNLRQGLHWQNGAPLTAYDIKFSFMAERDFAAQFGTSTAGLLLNSTNVISNTELDLVMSGVSVDWLPVLGGTFIIPRFVWELRSGPGSAGTPQGYGEVGVPDPARVDQSFDPLQTGNLIGSSEYACVSVGGSQPFPAGYVGGGCAANSNGTPAGQALGPDATVLLSRYDFTSSGGDPLNQWIRSYNSAWGTGSGVAAHSGQFQEFRWADRFNNDTVTIRDLAQVAACNGASAPTVACPAADAIGPVFAHWHKTAFETSGVIGPEVATVAAHLDDTWVNPFSWSNDQGAQPGQTLTNITPWT